MQIQRKFASRQSVDRTGRCTGAKLCYCVSASGNLDQSDEAFELVCANAPYYMGRARREKVELVKVPGNGTYEFEVTYLAPEIKEEKSGNERIWSFEINCAKEQIFEAKELVKIYPVQEGITPVDPGSRINWDGEMDGESRVNGTQILIPQIYEYCVATYRYSKINTAFRKKVFALAGKLNAQKFHGWAPGEVLFVRADQSEPYTNTNGTELVDITYSFAIRPAGEISCAGVKTEPVSLWNTIWAISRRDAMNNAAVTCGVYESRIYDYGNFSTLDL